MPEQPMSRHELIEKAARASHKWAADGGLEHAEWDGLGESVRRQYRENVAAILDAVLPQVTTAEELEAFPERDAVGESPQSPHLPLAGTTQPVAFPRLRP